MPKPVSTPPAPKDLNTVEELCLAGQRIEQFHSPSLNPEPYWEEALRRDPGDARVNTVFGIRKLRQARFAEAEAISARPSSGSRPITPPPRTGKPFTTWALALKAQGRLGEARDALYKATWSQAWRAPAYYSLAELATLRGDRAAALDLVNRSLEANALDSRALTLKAALLRHAGQTRRALAILDYAERQTDPLDVGLMAERWLAQGGKAAPESGSNPAPLPGYRTRGGRRICGRRPMAGRRRHPEGHGPGGKRDQAGITPLAYYYLGDFAERLGEGGKASNTDAWR